MILFTRTRVCFFSSVAFLLSWPVQHFAQESVFEKYTPLRCTGDIPAFFIQKPGAQLESDLKKAEQQFDKSLKKEASKMFLGSQYTLHGFYSSGRLMYGDILTNYINKVADNIKKHNPQLSKEMQFFGFRSAVVNAHCLPHGIITFNIGLFASLNNEAELAYILCHEIAHYEMKHALHTVMDNHSAGQKDKNVRKKSRSTYEEKLDRIYSNSKKHELEADSLGLALFAATPYHSASAKNVFTVLHHADFSYFNEPVERKFFDVGRFSLPATFFPDSVAAIKPVMPENDRYYSHPNLWKRNEQFENLARVLKFAGKDEFSVTGEKEFQYIREVARFERVRLQLLNRNYGDAIYEAYCLLKNHPDNEYLEICIAKAYYGLAKYKNADEYHRAARQYTKVQGESQQMHYVLKQFDRKQLNTYALKQLNHYSKKYPANTTLKYLKNDLIKDVVVTNELKLQIFMARENEDASAGKLFYRALLQEEINDKEIVQEFEKNYPLLEKRRKEDELPYDARKKLEKKKKNEIAKYGHKIFAGNIIVMPPVAHIETKNNELDWIGSDQLENEIESDIGKLCEKEGIRYNIADVRSEKYLNSDGYNKLSRLYEWAQERDAHNDIEMMPLFSDQLADNISTFDTRFVYTFECLYNGKTNRTYYEACLLDLNTGRVEYRNWLVIKGAPKSNNIQKIISRDLQLIKK